MIGLGDTIFTLSAPMIFVGKKEAIFDLIKVAPGSLKVAPDSYKMPVNREPLRSQPVIFSLDDITLKVQLTPSCYTLPYVF